MTAATAIRSMVLKMAEASAAAPKRARMQKAAMTLTPSAVNRLRQLVEGPDPKLIRVAVKNKGCAGQTYVLEYIQEKGKLDEVVKQDGVTVLIDSKSLFKLIGCEMDYVKDRLSSKFVFNNPNAKESCGCGESFSVK